MVRDQQKTTAIYPFFLFICSASLRDGLRLLNDSNIDLTATIRGNTGKVSRDDDGPCRNGSRLGSGAGSGGCDRSSADESIYGGLFQSPYTVVWTTKGRRSLLDLPL